MTNRVQTIRSNVTGARATGRPPGELYVNWADNALGVSTPAQTPQDLVAVRYFSPSANYVVGDHVVQGGFIYRANAAVTAGAFNPAQWQALSTAGAYLPLSGGAMTGELDLFRDPVNPLEAATKHYVDSITVGSSNLNTNRLINGDFRIAQRGTTGGNAVSGFICDRWGFLSNVPMNPPGPIATWGRNLGSGAIVPGFPYYGRLQTAATAYTPGANDYWVIGQYLEGDDISDLQWGTSGALPVTLSFWVRCNIAGSFSGSISNYIIGASPTRNRSYPFGFNIPTANTWTKVTIPNIPGDTAGTWTNTGNTPALILNFCYTAGANWLSNSGSWAAGNYIGVIGSTQLVSSAGLLHSLDFTGVKLEVGNVATPYQKQKLTQQLQECQRYCCKTYNHYVNPGSPTGNISTGSGALAVYGGPTADTASSLSVTWKFPVTMRDAPNVTTYSPQSGAQGYGFLVASTRDISVLPMSQGSEGCIIAIYNPVSIAAREILCVHALADSEYNNSF